MSPRGPDGQGLWEDDRGRVALGHRRLAVIDLSPRGAQPMHSADRRYTIVFNGEIYNYKALRSDLEAVGRKFMSDSDTEVLLHLYDDRGVGMVGVLRGMFAFAIWDAVTESLFMARDVFGIKPLYYADDGRTIRFASEVEALVRAGGIDSSPDPAGHVGFFLWGHVPDPFTMYRGIRALPAGSVMLCRAGQGGVVSEYGSPGELLREAEAATPRLTRIEQQRAIHHALGDAVAHHLVADVDVGVFLSAGIDSTVLAALVSETGRRPRTVTLGFREFAGTSNDETVLAESVARRYGCDHQTVWITRADFERELPRFLDRMDQPTTDGVNTYFVSKAASELGWKVALSGLGGDELFAGYPSFRQLPRLVSAVRRLSLDQPAGTLFRRFSSPLIRRVASPKYASVLEYGRDLAGAYLLRRGMFLPWELPQLLDPEFVRDGLDELQTLGRLQDTHGALSSDRFKVGALEATWYMRHQLLRDTDWTSMTHGVEVRVPYVDATLWRTVAPLLASQKTLGKEMIAAAPARPLPASIVGRAKTGFGTPVRQWVADPLVGRRDRGLRGWARRVYAAQTASVA